ncbi:LPD7 domain-containing protein [Methylomonas albis]|uniref:Large polyvalent protein-associated domain-containing protein n=1 Tax=Methylomonas albis TaxID=1854563 RepID=A0ABR9D747_9GAMM|nr:LPD7 domain-containing protein [Methylomonas albis]MBD9358939.1 hypothetical protein [Methylomonas albis]
MLIRISGGESGIKDYLEDGQKQGRDYSREELDERVILDGDLKLTDAIIHKMNNDGDKYLHITLAFKEDEISRDSLQAITQDFKAFAFSAFQDDEYSFYAEAHLPRIKSYTHAKTGEVVERKPHIHIVIPKYNLLSGESLNPFGLVERQVKYLEAIQETLNNRYGLASPKDNRRALFTDDSEMLSRYKGDTFKGGNKVFKSALLTELLERQITDYDDFKTLLAEQGEVKIRNEGKDNEYLWIKPHAGGDGKGINLRDAAFSRDFIELSHVQKMQQLATESRYETTTPPRDNQAQYDQALQEWHKQRAKEIKYVYLGKRSQYDAYKQATVEEKAKLLIDREQRFYQKHLPEPIEEDRLTDTNTDHLETTDLKPATQLDPGPKTSVTGQLLHDHKAEIERVASNQEFAIIKQNLEAKRLLARLSHSHGVNPDKYPISKGQDGGDRIQAGTRKLNVSDFLTKELNLDYRTAGQILREVYQEQTGQVLETTPRQQARADLWKTYQAERQTGAAIRKAERQAQAQQRKEKQKANNQAIKTANQRKLEGIRGNRNLSPAERKAATSIAKMERIQAETAIREQAQSERERLAAIQSDEYRNGYRNWLAARAQSGDETALAELRKMQAKAKAGTDVQEIHSGIEAKPQNPVIPDTEPLLKTYQLSYQVHHDGTVTYRRGDTDVVRDEGRFVKVLHTEDETIETGLRLAQAKFGKKLTVRGSDAFRASVARVAAEKGLWVEFTDPQLNQLMAARKAELQQAREKTQTVEPAQPETPIAKSPSLFSSLAPNTELGRYTGPIVGVDKRYVFQAHGKDIIRHERSLFSTVPAQGDKIRISYSRGKMKAEPVQGKDNRRSRGQ